ncbi:hypothetical protein KC356_g8658 [Hortaea werneckii]|nr:hypothetical protein KC356_g8658 [Hortaea werneckii]
MAADNPNSNSNQDPNQLSTIEPERSQTEKRPDFSAPLPRKKLPHDLQETLDNEEKWWSLVTQGKGGESTDSSVRYAGYAARLRTIMLSAHRYVAYTSDVGESFRPVAHPYLVRGAYGVSWAYLLGDVGYEGYKAYVRNQATRFPNALHDLPSTPAKPGEQGDAKMGGSAAQAKMPDGEEGKVAPIDHWGTVMAQRALFQGLASMGLPAFTIHSIVRYSGRYLQNAKNARIRTWGPIGLGLAAVPALPYIFDEPVEKATEWVFHKGFEAVGGPEAVGHKSVVETLEGGTGRRKEGVVGVGDKEL